MGRHPHLALAAALALLLAPACRVPRPSPAALVATGFRAPEQTFRTFQTALAADLVELEYRCFGADFKRREGLTLLNWRAFREDLLARWPSMRRLATAEVIASEALAPDRWRLIGRVRHFGVEAVFQVELVREDFYELYEGNERSLDGSLDWDGLVSVQGAMDAWSSPSLAAHVPLPEPIDPATLTEVRLGREWKIDGLERLEP